MSTPLGYRGFSGVAALEADEVLVPVERRWDDVVADGAAVVRQREATGGFPPATVIRRRPPHVSVVFVLDGEAEEVVFVHALLRVLDVVVVVVVVVVPPVVAVPTVPLAV